MEKKAIKVTARETLFLKPCLSMKIPAGIASKTKVRGHTIESNETSKALTEKIFLISEEMGANVSHNSCDTMAASIKTTSMSHLYLFILK